MTRHKRLLSYSTEIDRKKVNFVADLSKGNENYVSNVISPMIMKVTPILDEVNM